jgi:uncharacterized protein YndB with AHSA1/START domain
MDRKDRAHLGHGCRETVGAETVVTMELAPARDGTRLRLTHRGFEDEASARQHEQRSPQILEHLDEHVRSRG